MNEQELRKIVAEALTEIAPEADLGQLDPQADFAEQLDIDSMDFLNLIVSVHERTGISVPERDYGKLTTLEQTVAYLRSAQDDGTAGDER